MRQLLLSQWVALRWPVKIIAAGAAAFAGVAYTLLAGAEVPTVRSCLATLIVLVGLCLGRQAISLRMVAAVAYLILIVRPEALLGPSFQLSFAAVTAIVVFYQSRVGRSLASARGEAGLVRRFGNGLLALVLTGLLVEPTLAPIALGHFGRTGFYGVLANVVAIPFTSFVVMPAAAAALLLDPLGLAGPAYAALGWSLGVLIGLANTVAAWPGAVSRLPTMPTVAFAATATDAMVGWADEAAARCNRDVCVTVVERGGRRWRLLATRSKTLLDWKALTHGCAEADIVVNERWLPDACRPRWLKLDRAQLAKTGAVAIWFDPLRVRSVADAHGDHPWATAAPAQWYRRSRPTSLPWMRTRDGR